MIPPGKALPSVHMMICCPGSTSLPQVKFIFIRSRRIDLNSTPGQLLRSVYMEKSNLDKAENPPLEVAPGQGKTHVNSNRSQTVGEAKLIPWPLTFPGLSSYHGSCEQAPTGSFLPDC